MKLSNSLRKITRNTERNSKKTGNRAERNTRFLKALGGAALLSILPFSPLSEGLKSLQDSSTHRGGKNMFLFQQTAYAQPAPKSEVMNDEQRKMAAELLKQGITPEQSKSIFDYIVGNPMTKGEFLAGLIILIGTYVRNKNKAKTGFMSEAMPLYETALNSLEDYVFSGDGEFQKNLRLAIQKEAKSSISLGNYALPATKSNVKLAKAYLQLKGVNPIGTGEEIIQEYSKSKYLSDVLAKMNEIKRTVLDGIIARVTKDPNFNKLTGPKQVTNFNLTKVIQDATKTEIELRYNTPKYGYVKVDAQALSHIEEATKNMKNSILSNIKPISNKYGFWKELKKGFKEANLKGKVGRSALYFAGISLFLYGTYNVLSSGLTDERQSFRIPSSSTRNLDYSQLNNMYYVRATTPTEGTISEELAAKNKSQLDAVYGKDKQNTMVPFLAKNLKLPWVRFNNLIQFGMGLQRDAQFNAYPHWWENKGQKGGNSWKNANWAFYKFDNQGQTLTNSKKSYGVKMVIPPIDKGNRRKVHTYFGVQAIEVGQGGLGNEAFLPEVGFENGIIYFGKQEGKKQLGTYPKSMAGKSVWVSITLIPPAESKYENGSAIVTIHQNKTKILDSKPIPLNENFKRLMEGGKLQDYEMAPSITVMQ